MKRYIIEIEGKFSKDKLLKLDLNKNTKQKT